MKKIIILILIGVLILPLSLSCARITYKDGELSYFRLGKQEIKGFAMEKRKDGTLEVQFNEQKGDAGQLAEALLNVTELINRMALIP